MTDNTVIDTSIGVQPLAYDASLSVQNNIIAELRREYDKIIENLIEMNLTRPILNDSGQKLQDITEVQTQYENILARKVAIESMLLSYEKSITDSSKIAVAGDWSAIECVKLSYTYSYGMTTQWGQNHLDSYTRRLLALLVGIENDPLSNPAYSVRFDDQVRQFEEAPRFVKNFNREFYQMSINNGNHILSNYTTSFYTYPAKLFSLRAIKNLNLTTEKNVVFKLNASHYSSYGVAGVVVYTPNQTNSNRSGVTDVIYSNPYNIQSSGFTSFTNVTVSVPANTTVLVMLIGADYYFHTSGYSYAVQRLLRTKDENLILNDTDIVQDNDLINNIVQSVEFGGTRKYTSIEQLWSLPPSYNNLDKLFNTQLLTTATSDENAASLGVPLNGWYKLADGTPRIRIS